MTTCSKIEQQLFEWLDGRLGEKEIAELESHLKNCVGCQNLAGQYRRLTEPVEIPARGPVAAKSWDNLMRRIDGYEAERVKPVGRWRPVVAISLRSLGLAAAVAVGIYLGYVPTSNAKTAESDVVDYYANVLSQTSSNTMINVFDEVGSEEGSGK